MAEDPFNNIPPPDGEGSEIVDPFGGQDPFSRADVVDPFAANAPEGGQDLGGFSEGFQSVDLLDDSVVVNAGGLIFEKMTETLTQAGADLVKANQQSKIYEKWQPQIWNAEDQLNSISDKHSPEYQSAWENLQNTKKNFRDDLEGRYSDTEPFSFDQFTTLLKENPGYMVGAMAKSILADPELLAVPGGWLRAGNLAMSATKNASKLVQITSKLAAQSAGAAVVATPFGAATEIVQQMDANPNRPIDYERVRDTAIFTGAIAAALPPLAQAGKVAGKATSVSLQKLGEIADARTIRAIQADAQKIYLGALRENGPPLLTKEAAVNRAIAGKQPSDAVIDNLPTIDDYMSDAVLASRQAKMDRASPIARGIEAVGEGKKKAIESIDDLIEPITSTLQKMGLPHIAKRVFDHHMNLGTDIDAKQLIVAKFSKEYGKLTPTQQTNAHWHMVNGTLQGSEAAKLFPKEFLDTFTDDVRVMLEDEFKQMSEVGMKVGYTPDYFPREFDYVRYMKDNGVDPAQITKDLADQVNKKLNLQGRERLAPADMNEAMIRKHLDANDFAEIIGRKSGSTAPEPSLGQATIENRARSIETVPVEMMKYYKDPRAALHNHVNRVTPKIHDRRLFGGKKIDEDLEGMPGAPDDETIMGAYINDYVARLAGEGQILPSEMDRVVKILRARFIGGRRKASTLVNGTKNIMYAATLGNPIAAAVQAGDIGAAQYLNVTRGIDSLIGEAIEGTRFKMRDFGLESLPELESMGATRKVLNWSLRAGGFRAMDQLGKETILNSTYKKLRDVTKKLRELEDYKKNDRVEYMFDAKAQKARAAEQEKVFKYFKNRYGRRLGESEVQDIIDGVMSGDPKNHHARLAMYSDLTRVQPISMAQMPVMYLNHPNARIFYMLKSFTLKQIDLMRREVIAEITEGVKKDDKRAVAAGALNLAKIAGTIGLANMGVEYVKRWMRGDDVEMTDLMVSTALRNYGLSEYTLDNIMRGNIAESAGRMVAPPVSVFENPIKEAMGVDTKGRWIDSFPVVGRTAREAAQFAEEHL